MVLSSWKLTDGLKAKAHDQACPGQAWSWVWLWKAAFLFSPVVHDWKLAVLARVWWIVASGKGYEIQITEPKNIRDQIKVNSTCCHYLELGIIKKCE